MKQEKERNGEVSERRYDPRSTDADFVSVEFCTGPLDPVFLFRIRDESQSRLGILVKEGSKVLEHLSVGEVLNMKDHGPGPFERPIHLKTKVMHITKKDDGQFKGHYLVVLSIVKENQLG